MTSVGALGFADLPAFARTRNGSLIQPKDDLAAFVALDLDLARLEGMVNHGLWLAGRLGNIRPLHRQKELGRDIVITERADLHLLWHKGKFFIKPLPSYLLDDSFFKTNIQHQPRLLEAANGFLYSYARLINYHSDFQIAKQEHLVPPFMQWADWKALVDTRLGDIVFRHEAGTLPCSPRFRFGELRLSRVDLIYRLHPMYGLKHLMRGYHTQSHTYSNFLNRHYAWLIAVFAYVTIVLTAMQVGLATSELQLNDMFNRACYGFTVFAILLPLGALVLVSAISAILTFYHVAATRRHLHTFPPLPRK